MSVCKKCGGRKYYHQQQPDCMNCEEASYCEGAFQDECCVPSRCELCNGSGIEKSCEVCKHHLTACKAEYEGKKLPNICFTCGDVFNNFTQKEG